MKYQTIKQIFAATVTFVVFSSSVAFAKVDDRTTEQQKKQETQQKMPGQMIGTH